MSEVDQHRSFAPTTVGRKLAGVECPICHADLTVADLARSNCGICGYALPSTLIDTPIGQIRQGRVAARPVQESSNEVKSWPDDAPLW